MIRQALSEGLPAELQPVEHEAIRRRPGMFFGDTYQAGIVHVVAELIGNSLDEHLDGAATFIDVRVAQDGTITIRDDGRGISLERRDSGRTTLELAFTTWHTTPTFDGHHPHVHVTRNQKGFGLGAIAVVCTEVNVETWWRGDFATARFERGVLQGSVERKAATEGRGTKVSLKLDPTIFTVQPEPAMFRPLMTELARLTPRLTWRLQGRRLGDGSGLSGLAVKLARGTLFPGSLLCVGKTIDGVQIEAAISLRIRPARGPLLNTYVNFQPTKEERSSDRVALQEAVKRAFPAEWSRLSQHLVGAMHLGLLDPRFEGPTRARLHVPEVRPLVTKFLATELRRETDARIAWLEFLATRT